MRCFRFFCPSLFVILLMLPSVGLLGCGSVQQTMTINSDPPGALVYLNDEEVGRTPLKRDFVWHGDYEIEVRKEGYQPLKTHQWVVAPWWNWAPIDLFDNLAPLHLNEQQHLFFALTPTTRPNVDPDLLMARAEEMRANLESSSYTPKPATRPTVTTRPAPITRSATTQSTR